MISLQTASDKAAVAALWASRKALSPALRQIAPKKINEDVVVPVSRMAQLTTALGIDGERILGDHRQLRPCW